MAGVPMGVVERADGISQEFFKAFKEKLAVKRRSDFPLEALADFTWLMRVALDAGKKDEEGDEAMTDDIAGGWKRASKADQMEVIRNAVGRYAVA